jgi:hypothetical protein
MLRKCEFLILRKWFRNVNECTVPGKTGQYLPTGRIEPATPRLGIWKEKIKRKYLFPHR